MLHGRLKAKDLVVNREPTYRPYTQHALQVGTIKRKKLTRPRQLDPMNADQWILYLIN
jgi:putative transposase